MTHNCTFDPDAHRYTIAGKVVPSVTQVLGVMLPGWKASEWHLERGRAVHACAAMIARGKKFDYDLQIAGQVAACLKFFAEVRQVVLAVEHRVFSLHHQYAGTLDLLIQWGPVHTAVVDWKSTLSDQVPYQVAAYAEAYGEQEDALTPRYGFGVELRENGRYQMGEVYDLKMWRRKWLEMLRQYKAKQEDGE